MWKVSFDKPYPKVVNRINDKCTVVTLWGTLKLPDGFLKTLPRGFFEWFKKKSNPKIGCYSSYGINLDISVKGKAVRADSDEDDPKFAEILAECRAKMRLYDFVVKFLNMYMSYYNKILTGIQIPVVSGMAKQNTVMETMVAYQKLYNKEKEHLQKLLNKA